LPVWPSRATRLPDCMPRSRSGMSPMRSSLRACAR
jgi:hypothetical protein